MKKESEKRVNISTNSTNL